jgi:hypothetical protein
VSNAMKPRPIGAVRSRRGLSRTFQQGAARVDALNDVHTIEHAACGAVPFPAGINRLLELRTGLGVSATRLLPEDGVAPSERRAAICRSRLWRGG